MPDDLRDQFPKVREVVKALRIPVYEMPATRPTTSSGRSPSSSMRARTSRRRSSPVDLDMLQLVTAAGPADDDPLRGREHGHLRLAEDRRAVRAAARPDDRLQGAQGRPDRQHPGRPRRRREDRGEAHPRVRRPRHALRAHRRRHAREAARQAPRASGGRSDRARTSRRSSATCRSSSTSTRPDSATTTGRPSSGCSASTSSGP